MNPIQQHAASLVGLVLPVVIATLKTRLFKVSDFGAHLLSLGVAVGSVVAAHVVLRAGLGASGIAGDAGIAYALSSTVYQAWKALPNLDATG